MREAIVLRQLSNGNAVTEFQLDIQIPFLQILPVAGGFSPVFFLFLWGRYVN